MKKKLNVLMTFHNEHRQLEQSVKALYQSCKKGDVDCNVFLADLGSQVSPNVELENEDSFSLTIVRLTEDHFWAQGMLEVSKTSERVRHDYTMWLNNDVELEEDAISRLIATSRSLKDASVVIGSTVSSDRATLNYGGYRRGPFWSRLNYRAVEPSLEPVRVDFANGNILLYHQWVEERLGGFPKGFVHTGADFWFTWKASLRGLSTFIAPGFLGVSGENTIKPRWLDRSSTRSERFRFFIARNVQPVGDWLKLSFSLGGIRGPIYFISPFLRILLNR